MGLHLQPFALHFLALTFPLVVLGFSDETLEKATKSEGYCSRILRAQGTRREGYNEFSLRVEGDPEFYKPGNNYRVTLSAATPAYFRGFTLIALKEGKEGDKEEDHAGTFQIIDEEETQFMSNCPVAVTESTPRRRTRIHVFWTAPPVGTGCVILKASIVQKRIIYFQDEGSLTKKLCEQDSTFEGVTDKPILDCCACGTAKYRLTFYGNWSEKMHPKDYPRRANHWSAIIGGSHSKNYVLWEYGGYASEGVKQVAELGSPVKMEEEIRQQSDEVLTVIKAKAQWPAWQPLNVRAAPSAEFSVDRTRHLMSFLTMLGPSPDWNVGLSAEDLCTKDCGWVQKVVQDLIPWDAGTDSGVTYESPNKPTIPQEKIRPLTSLDHPQSPFYDPEGGSIAVVARVVIERIARKGEQCNIIPDNVDDIVADLVPEEKEEDDTPETCIYSNWSPWSACSSSTCDKGKRMRQRMLKAQLDLSVPCPDTQDFQPCMGPGCSDEDGSTCMMSEWITWSPCTVSCGMGMRSRERYVKQFPDDGSMCKVPTEETEKCIVNEECSPSSCLVTEWAEWNECSASCGMGMKKRHRMIKMTPADGSMCNTETTEVEKCMMPECHTIPCMLSPWSEWSDCSVTCGKGMRTRQRMLKSAAELGDCNEELEQVEKCMLPECPIDCELTEWSKWSECNKSCGKGHMIRTRMIQMEPQFGGAPCPETVQRKKCRIRKCLRGPGLEKRRWKEAREKRRSEHAKEDVDGELYPGCKMRPWTAWSECTKLCGGGIQERFMTVKKRFKSTQFTSCKDKKEIRACNVHPC
ncbi:peroxisome proliferator-activated receptor gamma coactivator 1-beta-like [Platysternon megacephalum]|uniref:Spondin-1 n=1 Tax=Platysternon megacephalum TaxID=55544 RepID=A0A4D9EMD1_9SAUR|nr:peroxisome proliferator-activated receptor gamma coactivator 1-beta-like [Platysternon megacephalum]